MALLVISALILTGQAMYFSRPAAPFQNTIPEPATWPSPPADPGIVWVDTRSHIYHFPGYRWYGTTIEGKYFNEQDAVAEGDRAALNERRPADFGIQVPH